MSKSPFEIIVSRSVGYKNINPKQIYECYHEESNFRQIFTSLNVYETYFTEISSDSFHAGLKIVSERRMGNLSEVTYVENFMENGTLVSYFSKSLLKLENDKWKILWDKRECLKNVNSNKNKFLGELSL